MLDGIKSMKTPLILCFLVLWVLSLMLSVEIAKLLHNAHGGRGWTPFGLTVLPSDWRDSHEERQTFGATVRNVFQPHLCSSLPSLPLQVPPLSQPLLPPSPSQAPTCTPLGPHLCSTLCHRQHSFTRRNKGGKRRRAAIRKKRCVCLQSSDSFFSPLLF